MGVAISQYVKISDVLAFVGKHARNANESRVKDFAETLMPDKDFTEKSHKKICKDIAYWLVFVLDKQDWDDLRLLGNALDYLIADQFSNFIVHPDERIDDKDFSFSQMSYWDSKMR